jgi:hypothetical protein
VSGGVAGYKLGSSGDRDALLARALPLVVSELTGRRGAANPEEERQIALVLKSVLSFLTQNLGQMGECGVLLDALAELLSPERPLFKECRDGGRLETINKPWECYPVTENDFVAGLKVGDLVDAVKLEYGLGVAGWIKSRVVEITSQYFHLHALGDKFENVYTIKRPTAEIEAYDSRTKGDNWRFSLQMDDVIDCYDSFLCWYNSTVVSVDRKERVGAGPDPDVQVEYKIGFRVFVDQEQKGGLRKHEGWSNNYDETVMAGSPRLRLRDTLAKHMEHQPKQTTDYLEDHNDLVFD